MKSVLPLLTSLALLFVLTAPLSAHEDVLITLKDGRLEGLPEQYQPAHFDEEKKVLRIAKHEMVFPPYLESLFPKEGNYQLRFTSSWYHGDFGGLPPYLNLQITPKNRDFGYNILFDLNSLQVIWINVTIFESPHSTRYFQISLSPDQKKSLADAVRVVK
jgi:hypothetical protein